MKVTAVRQQVNRKYRYSVYVDGKYSFSLSENELLVAGISVGQELDEAELKDLNNRASLDKAYMRSIDLISRRARSEWEIRDYLKRKGYGEETQNHVVQRLVKAGLLNDMDFARQWVSSRRVLKLSSSRKLAMELRQKRIADDVISEVLGSDDQNDRHALRELVERKRRQNKYHDKLKLMQYLSRQGFNYDDIKAAIEDSSGDDSPA